MTTRHPSSHSGHRAADDPGGVATPAAALDPRTEPTAEQIQRHLRFANGVARRAAAAGHHPFGAILVGADHETVLMAQGNVDTVNHAESVLARLAARTFTTEELWRCTLYTTVEPCCMCAGTQYWAHIGRLVYGMTESRLLEFTGSHVENPTMDLPCREVFARGQKAIRVVGPVAAVEAEIATLHIGFWRAEDGGETEVGVGTPTDAGTGTGTDTGNGTDSRTDRSPLV